MNKELEEIINRGNKRLAIVCSTMAFILAIPTLCAVHFFKEYSFPIVILYMFSVLISMLFSVNIVTKIWKTP